MLDFYRQFSHANAGGVMDRRRDGSSHAGQADLADAACPNFVNLCVGVLEEVPMSKATIFAGFDTAEILMLAASVLVLAAITFISL